LKYLFLEEQICAKKIVPDYYKDGKTILNVAFNITIIQLFVKGFCNFVKLESAYGSRI